MRKIWVCLRAVITLFVLGAGLFILDRYEYLANFKEVDNIVGMIPVALAVTGVAGIFCILWVKRIKLIAAALVILSAVLFPTALRGNWWINPSVSNEAEAAPDLTLYAPFSENSKLARSSGKPALSLSDNLPVLDGATALYPVYAAFAEAVYDKKAFSEDTVLCTNTRGAYEAIIRGERDIVFVAGASDEQIGAAKAAGADLCFTPIGREAFVFLVGRENPTDNITYQQLRNIYSGKTAYWKTIGWREGGRIIAWQRPEGSGSQTGLLKMIMNGLPLQMPQPIPDAGLIGTNSLMKQVSVKWNGVMPAIGYSYRFYAAAMYANPDAKLLKVNGTYPSIENIQNGSYPFTGDFYAVTNGEPSGNTKLLIDWILSEQGQEIIEKTGYTPLNIKAAAAAESEADITGAAEWHNKVEFPVINGINWTDCAYNSSFDRDFIYNPYDDCFYISMSGESPLWEYKAEYPYISLPDDTSQTQVKYPWDPPEIEQFCKINAQTGEVTELLNREVGNLVYSGSYVYFYDESKIKRIKDDKIEELPIDGRTGFFVENNYLYILIYTNNQRINDISRIDAYNLEDMRRTETTTLGSMCQIYGGTIYSFSEYGFHWIDGAGKIGVYTTAVDLIKNYYGDENDFSKTRINSFVFDGNLWVKTGYYDGDLFLIKPETDEIELVAHNVAGYTPYNGYMYYVSESEDALYSYNIERKKTEPVVSFFEDYGLLPDSGDYFGFENLTDVRFVNGRCFLYFTGMNTYSQERIAELDLDSKSIVYLTDYFDDKSNIITSFYYGTFSFEYPNDYSVFIDYGSSGGTIISNFKKHIRININSMAMNLPELKTVKGKTNQGYPIYYEQEQPESYFGQGELWSENVAVFAAAIPNDVNYIRIRVVGSAEEIEKNEAEILNIIKSICVIG